jgi:hypothetical protein
VNRIEKTGALLFGAAILAALTVSYSGHVCSDCGVIRVSYDVVGIPIVQWKTPTRLTELLDAYGENPTHSHQYVTIGRSDFFKNASGAGAVLVSRFGQRNAMDFLEMMYRFEDRQEARSWRAKLLRPDDSLHRFEGVLGEYPSQDIPKDEAGWRSWWAVCRSKFENALFPKTTTAP